MNPELSWFANFKRVYFGNATATRDMRVQLRGSKAAVMFTIYLAVMAFVLLMVYYSSLGDDNRYSLASAQSTLQAFYYETLVALGVVVTLAAPSLGAFAIVSEKHRRSLDLVFSAPTEPKYYLVGKLISSFRYVWLLLVLSLPFCAISVTLGGTTWGQLIITFFLFSLYGLVCVSFGLLMSTLCSKVLPAIIWTYTAILFYWLLGLGTISLTGFSGGSLSRINPFSSFLPVTFPFVADQTWPVFGREVPTWILTTVLHLVLVKLIILAAGSLLAPGTSKEIRNLRIHGLIYTGAFSALLGYSAESQVRSALHTISGTPAFLTETARNYNIAQGRILFGILFLIGILVVPYLAGYGFNDLRRHRPSGFFNIREFFTGRPSGHLPYLIVLGFVGTLGYIIGTISNYSQITSPDVTLQVFTPEFLMSLLLIANIWYLGLVIGFYVCGKVPQVSRGRTVSLFFFILGLILPTAFFAIVAPDDQRQAAGVWVFNPMTGILSDFNYAKITLVHGLALTCISVILTVLTLPRIQKQSSIQPEKLIEAADDRN